MTDTRPFGKLVPGFDFLQGLVKNAGAALPNMGQWVAPTLNPVELDKRIEELRTVQFWLEQNARMLGATIQAMEVQRMTLSTLKTMNLSMGELRDAMTLKTPASAPAAAPPGTAAEPPSTPSPTVSAETAPPPGVVDPMQWWSALTQQFTELATHALTENSTGAAKNTKARATPRATSVSGTAKKKATTSAASMHPSGGRRPA